MLKKILGLVVVLFIVGSVINELRLIGNNKGYSPTQPIPFSHKIHAGQYNIPCLYCHVGADKSKHASVPPMNVCMNCHSVVKTDSPWIQKLHDYYKRGEPIPWIKVHDLPDFVHFNHKRHVLKGVACETCHGDVKNMAVIKQANHMSMGWCLDCHRGNTAPAHIARATAEMAQGTGIPVGGVAPQSCNTCHH